MPHEDYCYALERENKALNEKYEDLRQQLAISERRLHDVAELCATVEQERDELRQQLAESDNDMLRLLETIKYLRGIAVRGSGIEQPNDQTVEQFVIDYVVGLEQQLAEAQSAVKMLRDALEYYAEGGANELIAVNARKTTEPKP